ncbi:hypothetical protein BC936DRAFT_147001 [Jimgerdemannia flammicorona]|uniref:Uncharacterized protein n=2 Tax=Jimgerdemannia flammicorona TaxID=994334 RepID=A0A433QHY3_9FUNG|nr:hypothetical protein BC936DRAFT_147001 [Jimgerdemannia flammicorona]RUS29417.1 hypothetical protein BC938DRAFT_480690 [Jimgerdemannia flammicorona]
MQISTISESSPRRSKQAHVTFVIELDISFSGIPRPNFAATNAKGYPVAFDASADDLDNRALTSMIQIQRILDVAFADDAQVPDNVHGGGTKHVVVFIRQGLRWSDNNGVAGVDAEWVKVLHVAHGDTVVHAVADDLVLNFLPAFHRLLDQDLR